MACLNKLVYELTAKTFYVHSPPGCEVLDRFFQLGTAEQAAATAKDNLIDIAMVRLARTGATGAPPHPEAARNEAQVLTRLAPTPERGRAWANVAATITARSRHGQAVNLDPAALVLDTVFKMQETAAG